MQIYKKAAKFFGDFSEKKKEVDSTSECNFLVLQMAPLLFSRKII